MKTRIFLGGFALGCATMLLAATSISNMQDAEPPGDISPEMQEMMKQWEEAMTKYGNPSEHHKELAKREGSWTATGMHYPAPGAPGQPFEGEANMSMIMDGRFLFQEFSSDFEGTPFTGGGVTGYDRMKKKYVAMWIDNMSTSVLYSEGEKKDGAYHFYGEMPDMMAGKFIKSHTVEKIIDENTWVMEMYGPGPDGEMFKMMELTYKRN